MKVPQKLKNMYDPFRKTIPSLRKPEDSKSIVALFEYLGSNEGQGISVVEIEGDPALSFDPGLKKGEDERFQVAYHAEALFFEAVQDLRELMRNGGIKLKHKR